MASMLGVLTITVLIAATAASVAEPSQNALTDFGPISHEIDAKLINSQIPLQLHTPQSYDGPSVYFYATAMPNARAEKESSTNNGITLNNGEETYNKITSAKFTLARAKNSEQTSVRLVLNFGPLRRNNFILEVPIYKIPRAQSEATYDELNDWANKAKVGLTSPISVQQLSDVLHDKPVTLNLKWLEKLLTYGVRNSGIKKPNTKVYSARPIFVSEDIIEKIVQFVDIFIKKEAWDKKHV